MIQPFFLNFVGIELFATYSLFEYGLMGFFFQMILWGALMFAIYRPYTDKPFDKLTQILLPSILISFILTFMNVGAILNGLAVFIVLLISIKYYDKMDWHPFITLCIQFLSLIWIFANAREFSLLLFMTYILYNLADGQLKINKRNKENKKK